MSQTENEVGLSPERSVNDILREALQQISDQHHIVVTEVEVEWTDLSSNDGPDFKVKSLSAKMTTY